MGIHKRRLHILAILTLCTTLLFLSYLRIQPAPLAAKNLPKKLIEFGWDMPNPGFIKQNVQQMEKRPFEGIITTLKEGKKVFLHQPYDLKSFTEDMNNLRDTKFSKFTDNFILMWATTDEKWDWFSESDWAALEHNIRLFAQMAQAGRYVGIAFDPEVYKQFGANPWMYSNLLHAQKKSFEEYSQQVRKRGEKFIQALQQELPGMKLLTLFQLSFLPEILDEPNSTKQMRQLSTDQYALLPAFLNGMLDGAQPNTVIIDGNENAYYYSGQEDFAQTDNLIRQKALALIAPENHQKYARQLQVGQAVYIDHLFALRQPQTSFLSYYLTPKEREKWLEHNMYHALSTSDEYVWCYSERMNWWKNNVPEGVEEAIRLAQQKFARRESLGFNMENIIHKSKKMMRQSKIRTHIAKYGSLIQSWSQKLPEIFNVPKNQHF